MDDIKIFAKNENEQKRWYKLYEYAAKISEWNLALKNMPSW